MVSAVGFEHFKSFASVTVRLPRVGVLIGANASGKTNFIEGMRLASFVARGTPLNTLFQTILGSELLVRGRPPDFSERGFTLLTLEAGPLWWLVQLDLHPGGFAISGEGLGDTHQRTKLPLLEVKGPAQPGSFDLTVAYNNFVRGGTKPQITCVNQQSILVQCMSPARFTSSEAQKTIPSAAQAMMAAAAKMLFLDAVPGQMRGYVHRIDDALLPTGRNVSATLASLVAAGHGPQVLDFVRALPEQEIADIEFITTPKDEVMVALVETFGGARRSYDATQLSDGTLRILAIAAALLSVPEQTLVVVEELDNGLHPSRAAGLLRTIYAVAERRNIQVLLTTHNPALLDAVPDEKLAEVMYCYRDRDSGDSRITPLGELPRYDEVAAAGALGALVASGRLESLLAPRNEADPVAFLASLRGA